MARPPSVSVTEATWQKLQEAFHVTSSPAYRWIEATVWLLIVASLVVFGADFYHTLQATEPPVWLSRLDDTLLWVFVVEISLRILTFSPPELRFHKLGPGNRLRAHVIGRLRYCTDPFVLIDIITVLALHPPLRGLRALRLLRVARSLRQSPWTIPLQGILQAVRDNRLLYQVAFSLVGVATALGGLSFYLIEATHNDGIQSLGDAMWWSIVTITTVGYGDLSPVTGLGKVVAAALMLLGMITLALFAGIVGNTLLQAVMRIREEWTRMSTAMNHVVVCGYDPGARMLLDAILAEVDPTTSELYVFAPGPRPADVPADYRWIEGDPTKESELDKGRITHADAVLVVGARTLSPQDADARTILTTFTLRAHARRNPVSPPRARPLYVISEILDAENVAHARAAGADEVIETTRIGFSLLSHAIVQRGTADVLSTITAAGAHSLYVSPIPDHITVPAPYAEVAKAIKSTSGALLIGIHDARQSNPDQINPPDGTTVDDDVELIYLAESAGLCSRPKT
jgi:voltage-gated potassium channel